MLDSGSPAPAWRFVQFGLITTGVGEHQFLDRLLRSLAESGRCSFQFVARIGQLSPRSSPKYELKLVGTNKLLPSRDKELGLYARGFLNRGADYFVLVIDDLERARRPIRADVFARYRDALDTMLGTDAWRAAVFFLVHMLEAYYFADTAAVNAVLGTTLADNPDDVEDIGHPKAELKALAAGFDEVVHGKKINHPHEG